MSCAQPYFIHHLKNDTMILNIPFHLFVKAKKEGLKQARPRIKRKQVEKVSRSKSSDK